MLTTGIALIALAQSSPQIVPNEADVKSPDAIIAALYDVISGPAGQKRDWNRMRSLFSTKGTLTALVKNRAGDIVAVFMSPEEYASRSGPALERDGFFEKEIDRKVESRGNLMHVWSRYEARRKADDTQPFLSGTNAIQLFTDGKRWFIHSVLWE